MSDTHLTPDQLEAQIEAQRAQLADTVDALSHKLDVKAQARSKLDSLRARVGPQAVLGFVGAAVLVGGLVWWKKRR